MELGDFHSAARPFLGDIAVKLTLEPINASEVKVNIAVNEKVQAAAPEEPDHAGTLPEPASMAPVVDPGVISVPPLVEKLPELQDPLVAHDEPNMDAPVPSQENAEALQPELRPMELNTHPTIGEIVTAVGGETGKMNAIPDAFDERVVDAVVASPEQVKAPQPELQPSEPHADPSLDNIATAAEDTTMQTDFSPEKEAVPDDQVADESAKSARASNRVRKAVDRLVIEVKGDNKADESKTPKQGTGPKLRDIPNIQYKMSKVTGKDEKMEALHMLIYRRKGTANSRKKAILDHNGFSFEDATIEEKERASRLTALGKMKLELINGLMDLLDIKRGDRNKEDKMKALCDFIFEPCQLSTVDLAAKAQRDKAKPKRPRKASKDATAKRVKKVHGEKEADVAPRTDDDDSKGNAGDDTATKVPTEMLKQEVIGALKAMKEEELLEVTPRMLLEKMNGIFGCDLRSRKAEIKECMREFSATLQEARAETTPPHAPQE